MKKAVFSILSIMILFSCQKEEVSEEPVVRKSNQWSQAANPNNPYEHLEVGLYHNKGLEGIAEYRGAYSSDVQWINDVYTNGLSYYCSLPDPAFCPNMTPDELETLVNEVRDEESYNEFLDGLSGEAKEYVQQLLTIVDGNTEHTYVGFKQDVTDLEANIAGSAILGENEKEMLLGGTAVARYSGYYWSVTKLNEFSTSWSGFDDEPQPAAIDWGDVVKEDIKGGIKGGASCWCWEGAVTGAAVASAVEIIDQLWPE